jgi:DNA-binding SARP family transcriptional activator
MVLELRVFGGFVLTRGEQPIKVRDRRARALLTFLSFADKPVPRAAVATLLASDDDGNGRAAVRQARYVIRQATGDADPIVDAAGTLAFDPLRLWSDAGALTAALRGDSSGVAEPALAVYSGELLSGFRSPSEAFETWLRDQRLRLDEQMVTALLGTAQRRAAAGAPEAALELARRALMIDPLCEEAHRETMQALTAIGRRNASRRQLARCRDRLRGELGVAPGEATRLAACGGGKTGQQPDRRGPAEGLLLSVSAGAWADEQERRVVDAIGEALQVELGRLGHAVASPWCSRPDWPRDGSLELQVQVAWVHGRCLTAFVRLQHAQTGHVFWGERFDVAAREALAPAIGLPVRIAAMLGNPTYGRVAEAAAAEISTCPAERLSARQLCVLVDRKVDAADASSVEWARALLARAQELDPSCVEAWTKAAELELRLAALGVEDATVVGERTYALALLALRARPTATLANYTLGAAAGHLGERQCAARALEAALAHAGCHVQSMCALAWEFTMQGRTAEASALLGRGTDLDPATPHRLSSHYGLVAYEERRYADALTLFRRAPSEWQYTPQFYGAAAAGQLGQLDVVERISRSIGGFGRLPDPGLFFRAIGGTSPGALGHLLEGLRKAGLPIG